MRSGANKVPASAAAGGSGSQTPAAASSPSTTSDANVRSPVRPSSDPIPPIPPTPSPSTLTGLGGSPFGDMQMPNMDPEVMRQMMDSPVMQDIMGNPGIINLTVIR